MATKSIIKSVDIKNRKLGNALVYAMEKSKGKQSKKVILSRTCSEVTGDTIQLLFGEKK